MCRTIVITTTEEANAMLAILDTPGPWLFDAGSIYAECQIINGETIESPLAELLSGRQENWEANGLLMTAAPELLEALINLTEWGRTHTSPLDANSPHDLLIAAVNAISKATD